MDYDFLNKREIVLNLLNGYHDIRKKCQMDYPCNKVSITNYARPFLTGFFTLAIVGKMNIDKSILINALIDSSILPTGPLQVSSAITCIEHSDKSMLKVIFSDEHIEVFEGDSIHEELIKLTYVPIEYRELPIYEINRLISANYSAKDILNKKETIEEQTNCPISSKDLWIKYIEDHPQKAVAKEVHIQIPLCENFLGWRIIATPDIESIRHFQDKNNNSYEKADNDKNDTVDAIIIHWDADNLSDEHTKTICHNTIKQLTPETRQNIFFVLTQMSKRDCRYNNKEIISRVFSLYGNQYNIPIEHFMYVDCLLLQFCNDINKYNCDISMIEKETLLPGWDEADWKSICSLLTPVRQEIHKEGKEVSNETIFEKYHYWSNLDYLLHSVKTFTIQEKKEYFRKFLTLFYSDVNEYIDYYLCQINFLEARNEEIEKEQMVLRDKMGKHQERQKKILEQIRTLQTNEFNEKKDLVIELEILDHLLHREFKWFTKLNEIKAESYPIINKKYNVYVNQLTEFKQSINELKNEYS